jgi:1,4-dihydroxy-2-naphthoate octaprenyltransferase
MLIGKLTLSIQSMELPHVYAVRCQPHCSCVVMSSYFMSGGSRVVSQGKLKPVQLMRGATVLLGILVPLSIVLSSYYDRSLLWPLQWLALLAGWLYSMPPFRFSYRGYGEITQGLTLGVILPAISYHMMTGDWRSYPLLTGFPLTMIFFASNVNTSLPDVISDKASNRLTLAVSYGALEARQLVLVLMLAPAILLSIYVQPSPSSWIIRILIVCHAMMGIIMSLRTGAMSPRYVNTPPVTKRFVFTVATQQVTMLLLYSFAIVMRW